ncbi:MBL fold metallo-hydrolase [Pseudomonas sp. UL073]|uniref:MBL fold metallo-hydrolase n=1 Tax=Zestomonas insulae TaxID=2809017 RepID=A0ABS2IEA6_9GAMM|nr:MBL fold metallo-hydrolase [Pseudomonas insulae]MBM7061429.1 MBL fold metallo-hydrolase [Pseudomonas insulae]
MPTSLRPLWLLNLLSLLGRHDQPYAGAASDHFDGQRFRNLAPTPHKGLRELLKWQLNRPKSKPWVAPPAAPRSPLAERVGGAELQVTYINHATVLLQLHGLNILTDPLWSQRASPFSFAGPKRHHAPGLSLDQLPPIDLVLVSHNHYDHLDLWSLRELARRFPAARAVTGLGNGPLIEACGFDTVIELDWWQSLPLADGLRLHGVPVQHWSARSRRDTNQTLWLGFVLDSPHGPVLFPGDSGLGEEFKLIGERFGPFRFATLPIGAYEPRWFMRDHHMNPDDAVQAHLQLQSQSSMAIHFATFRLTDEEQFDPPRALRQALANHGVDAQRFRAPAPGEQWRVPVLLAEPA